MTVCCLEPPAAGGGEEEQTGRQQVSESKTVEMLKLQHQGRMGNDESNTAKNRGRAGCYLQQAVFLFWVLVSLSKELDGPV